MSADETTAAAGVDLDEDLFNFDEISGADALTEEDEADLDEIFASFQEQEEAEAAVLEPSFDEEPEAAAPVKREPADPPPPSPPNPAVPQAGAADVPAAPVSVAPPPAGTAPAAVGAGMPRTMLWLFVALTSVNALLAIVTLKISGSVSSGVQNMTAEVAHTIGKLATQTADALNEGQEGSRPTPTPDPAHHEAFATAEAMIENGQYADARRTLYALLAVVDRMDPALRAGVESRANYLIAHAYQSEAHDRMGDRR